MPLFEFRCRACEKRFTFLSGVVAGEDAPTCPRCQSSELSNIMSRFSRGRSDDARMESLADSLESQDLEDPRALRKFAREMGQQMGQETGEDLGDEMEALLESEAGFDGGGMGGGGDGDDGTIY